MNPLNPKKFAQNVVAGAEVLVGAVKDVSQKKAAIRKNATQTVGDEQKRRIKNVGQSGSPTPYSVGEFCRTVDQTAAKMQQDQGVSFRNSVRSKLGL